VAEPYRRLRNTLRILLGNLDGFDPAKDAVDSQDMTVLDRWILERLHSVVSECRKAYDAFEFRKVFNALNQFCTNDLSAVYIDVTKDRMYCDAHQSFRRRASQTAMYELFLAISKLLAPILAYTADEAWEHATFTTGTIHEQDFPEADPRFAGREATSLMDRIFEIRYAIQTAIEPCIQAKEFNRNNEAAVTLTVAENDVAYAALQDTEMMKEIFIIAELQLEVGAELIALAHKTELPLCPRCRRHEPLEPSGICKRCDDVMAIS
jgi:isoleucyl-tRNA synthetase